MRTHVYPRRRGVRGGAVWEEFYEAMKAAGHTEDTLAAALRERRMKATARAVDGWLRGQTTPPMKKLRAVAEILGVPSSALVDTGAKNISSPTA